MTAPAIADCSGLWRRSLLIGADGTRDTGGDVRWLQGLTGYVDSRGFAGRLEQQGDVFHWLRDVDLEPPGPFPDEGAMHWDGEVLVETGVHQVYAEHWVREDGPTTPVEPSSCGRPTAPTGCGCASATRSAGPVAAPSS